MTEKHRQILMRTICDVIEEYGDTAGEQRHEIAWKCAERLLGPAPTDPPPAETEKS